MASVNQIRTTFLDFFGHHGHHIVPSSPLVPRNDPTLLFTNAGMVQFKNVFTGAEKRDYVRAASSQKCVRAGGKHNDLENVGYTARHHTFFEMLGNFSFGDYFKEDAIDLAWKLVTKEFGLAADRLLVTVYAEDEEAAALWKKIAGLGDDRILRIASSDNFWSMGETGPCGPCSEIFYDHGPHLPGGPPGSPDEDGDRFVEIWNLVFMQYDQKGPGERADLPRPSIDTGMGLERMAAVLQGKHDNYDTDLLRSLILASAELTSQEPDGAHAVSHRVIADHLRATSFLISDGVLPSNEGRGYVLRRIMRRAMRHAHLLGARDPLMFRLVPELVRQMGAHYGELKRAEALITETLKLEETRFKQTLERGLKLLEEETAGLGAGEALPGAVAFKLYDTYGFPLDLTQDVLRGQGRGVDEDGFKAAMAHQRAEARKHWAGSGEQASEALWFDIRDRIGASEFLGYDAEVAEGQIKALVVDGREVDRVETGQEVLVIANQTPFYGESGGQIGDAGVIFSPAGAELAVDDTQRKADGALIVHQAKVTKGELATGDVVELRIDRQRRADLRAHHSATHLLHTALRRRLGDHVTQKGSLVTPSRLRFDIAHPAALAPEDLRAVESEVNAVIRANAPVNTRLMNIDAAQEAGALALFGEKYGDEVRVVAMGCLHPDEDEDVRPYSVELCGGTHVRRTGDIGSLRIVAEGAVGAGIRRIEAVAGSAADIWVEDQNALIDRLAGQLKASPSDLPDRIAALIEDRRRLEKDLADTRRQLATGGASAPTAKKVGDVSYLGRRVDGVPAKELKPMVDEMKKQIGSGVAAAVAVNEGKVSLVVGVTDDLKDRLNAVDLVRAGAAAVGGKGGGGRPDMAQAGGSDPDKADDALAAIEAAIAG